MEFQTPPAFSFLLDIFVCLSVNVLELCMYIITITYTLCLFSLSDFVTLTK